MDLRFLRKILTDAEIDRVRCSDKPDVMLWSFWACKEAVYKVIKKQTGDAAFVPRRWSVHFQPSAPSAETGGLPPVGTPSRDRNVTSISRGHVVVSEKHEIPFFLFSSTSYVHCLAADQSVFLDQAVWCVVASPDDEDGKGKDPSPFTRSCLAQSLSAVLHADEARIKISRVRGKRGELKPPAVYLDGIEMNIDVSLSHDGRFVAYAYLLIC
jgi:phosphopantetheinyl transferase (holo-ACP synthase)